MPFRPDAPADSVSLLIGAEADRAQRLSAQSYASSHDRVHKRFPLLFTEQISRPNNPNQNEEDGEERDSPHGLQAYEAHHAESSAGFLGRVNSYNRLMHAHTKYQMDMPASGTLPSYSKTMRDFTLRQLDQHRLHSRSETSSPHTEVKLAVRLADRCPVNPAKMIHELGELRLEELPSTPVKSPESTIARKQRDLLGIDFRKLKRRSITEPYVARDSTTVKYRDFAGGNE